MLVYVCVMLMVDCMGIMELLQLDIFVGELDLFPRVLILRSQLSVESRIQNSPRQKEQAWKLLELTRLYRLDHC